MRASGPLMTVVMMLMIMIHHADDDYDSDYACHYHHDRHDHDHDHGRHGGHEDAALIVSFSFAFSVCRSMGRARAVNGRPPHSGRRRSPVQPSLSASENPQFPA